MNHEEEISPDALREETIFNMMNAMLLRIHQSGHLAKLDEERKSLVKEGISIYKQIRGDIKKARPFWPLGLADYADSWVSLGLKTEEKAYLAVWKRADGPEKQEISLPEEFAKVRCIYPVEEAVSYSFDTDKKVLEIETDKKIMARLFEISR